MADASGGFLLYTGLSMGRESCAMWRRRRWLQGKEAMQQDGRVPSGLAHRSIVLTALAHGPIGRLPRGQQFSVCRHQQVAERGSLNGARELAGAVRG
jgi:hypothetical protein